MRVFRALLVLGCASACDTVSNIALEAGDFAGAKAGAHCDRRFVIDGGTPADFCQEIQDTVAASQFADDCRLKHQATPGTGSCPRKNVVAGCKLLEVHEDDSLVWDWYYAGSVEDVEQTCADRSRYESGAELALP